MTSRDHGGGIDVARAVYGGAREDWLDLSTGINPSPYKIGDLPADAWTALPDQAAFAALEKAARRFWDIPKDAAIVAAPGASALIAAIPGLWPQSAVSIPAPTYNEHAAAFAAHGWAMGNGDASVVVNPNNPDGRVWAEGDLPETPIRIIDESFCDTAPQNTLISLSTRPDHIILKSFGKFWGLAGMRLGFAICNADLAARLQHRIGPWAVSGPALAIGANALGDLAWAQQTRTALERDASRLDALLSDAGFEILGGTSLFRLVSRKDAQSAANHFARHKILVRQFPYAPGWLRFGLPPRAGWKRVETALETMS